jgi:excisionase family DNA binding protein
MHPEHRESADSAGDRLLTAREVQGLLQVDATTIYRMAADGRLPAVKVGRQWRFPREGVDAVLTGTSPAGASDPDRLGGASDLLDVTSVEAVLDVSAPLLGVMMVVTDMAGNPVSEVANPCPWFAEHADDEAMLESCTAEWRAMADDLDFVPHFTHGELGFECARVFIRSGSKLVGQVLAGGVATEGDETAGLYHLDTSQRQAVLDALPHVSVALSKALRAQKPHRPTDDRTTPAAAH